MCKTGKTENRKQLGQPQLTSQGQDGQPWPTRLRYDFCVMTWTAPKTPMGHKVRACIRLSEICHSSMVSDAHPFSGSTRINYTCTTEVIFPCTYRFLIVMLNFSIDKLSY